LTVGEPEKQKRKEEEEKDGISNKTRVLGIISNLCM
jgi:hypothetical protein